MRIRSFFTRRLLPEPWHLLIDPVPSELSESLSMYHSCSGTCRDRSVLSCFHFTPAFFSVISLIPNVVNEEHPRDWMAVPKMTRGRWFITCAALIGLGREVLGAGLRDVSEYIHVAVCAEKDQIEGLLVVVRSLLEACGNSNADVFFHVVSTSSSMSEVRQSMECASASQKMEFDVYEFNATKHASNVSFVVHGKMFKGYGLGNPLNFARFYLHLLLPWRSLNFEKVFYLDTDCVVQSCIAPIYDGAFRSSAAPVAAAHRSRQISFWLRAKKDHPSIIQWNKSKGFPVNASLVAFNAGVLILHLKRWEEMNILQDVLYWVEANEKSRFYDLGSNPPLILGLAGRVEYFDDAWNFGGLGYKRKISQGRLHAGKILHWTGSKKPWGPKPLQEYTGIWNQFRLQNCER